MNTLSSFITFVAVPAILAPVLCAADTPGALEGLFPTDGSLKQGAAVRQVYTPEFTQMQQALVARLQSLPEQKRVAFLEKFSPNNVPEYNADLWPDRKDYDKFAAEWKKTTIQPVTDVALGLQSAGKGIWRVLSATVDAKIKKTVPLTISALQYDAGKNAWISNNGELTASEYSATEDNVYGAQTGTEWNLTREDSLSRINETVRVTRTTDGKFIYVSYLFSEQSAVSGMSIAQGAYMLRFPVVTPGANMGTPGRR